MKTANNAIHILALLLVLVSVPLPGAAQASPRAKETVRAVRTLADRATGLEWLLAPDPAHPGGPGRLVLRQTGPESALLGGSEPATGIEPPQTIVVRAGDALVVEDQTGAATAHLDAVALEPAAAGRVIAVRLRASGARIHARAIDAHRALLIAEAQR